MTLRTQIADMLRQPRLLDVSRIVAGTLQLTPQPVDLVAVAQAALDAVRPLALAKNVSLMFSPDRPPAWAPSRCCWPPSASTA